MIEIGDEKWQADEPQARCAVFDRRCRDGNREGRPMELSSTSAIVTGGASGLGEATARSLAGAGVKVVVLDRDPERGSAVADDLGGAYVEADVTDEDQVARAVEAAAGLAPLRTLVNCAGIGRAARTLDRDNQPMPLRVFERLIKVNLLGSFNCARLAAAAMAELPADEDGQRGVIVHTASAAAFEGQIGQVPYSASKGGIVGMTLPMARDLARIGVRVNTIAPGLFDTPIYGSGDAADEFKEKLAVSAVFPNRLGYSEEFASLAMQLITNSFMNGETVRLDGAMRLPPK
jgi:NAD(P)-dependent dehydrogenase (short-subunit alcohol dehydrogenase family)